MSDAPYTGTSSAAAAVPSPRIRWGLVALVHVAAAFIAGFGFPVVMTAFDPQWIVIALVSGVVVAVIGGGGTLGLGALGFVVATRGGRGWGRETLGVMLGAGAGGAVIGVLLIAAVGVYGFALAAVAGVGSAIGLGIWVLVAWAPHLQTRPVR